MGVGTLINIVCRAADDNASLHRSGARCRDDYNRRVKTAWTNTCKPLVCGKPLCGSRSETEGDLVEEMDKMVKEADLSPSRRKQPISRAGLPDDVRQKED